MNKKRIKKFLEKNQNTIFDFLGVILLVVITLLGLFFSNNYSENKQEEELTKENNENIEYTFLEEGIWFNCNAEKASGSSNYNINYNANCEINIELRDKSFNISEINIEFDYDDEISYLKNKSSILVNDVGIGTIIEDKKINIKVKNNKLENKYLVKLGFYIASPESGKENLNIYFKNIVLKTKDGPYYKFNDNNISLKIEVPKYKIDGLVFYKHDDNEDCYKEISRYVCEEEKCNIFGTYALNHIDYNNGKLIIFDGESSNVNMHYYKNIVLYDFEKGVISKIKDISGIYNGWNYGETFVLENINNEMAIIDWNGKYIKEFSSKKFNLKCYEGCSLKDYSIENDVIVTSIDGKYGIEKISSNDIVIEHIFENINLDDFSSYDDEKRYSKNKYFKAKENGKWYLYSYETKEKVMNEGYDNFYIVDEEIIVVYDNNKIWIKDYNGNNLSKEFIELEQELCPHMPKNPEGIHIQKNGNILTINFSDGDKEAVRFTTKTYEFNIETKELNRIR